MARVKRGVTSHARHKKVLKQVKGQYGRRKNTIRVAKQALEKAMQYAYRDRRTNKRNFRRLWIIRINAAVRQHGLSYSKFISAMKEKNIESAIEFVRLCCQEIIDNKLATEEELKKIEKKIDVETIDIDLKNGEQLSPEFKKINPNCTVPVLSFDNGDTLTSTAGIRSYLEAKYPDIPLMGRTPMVTVGTVTI